MISTKLRKITLSTVTATMLATGILPSMAGAQVVDSQNEIAIVDGISTENVFSDLSLIEAQNLQKEVSEIDIEWKMNITSNGEIEYVLSDSQLVKALEATDNTEVLESVNEVSLMRGAGVTKIKKNSWGGYDIYLSALARQTIGVGGSVAIGAIVALIPGIGWSIAGAVVGAMLGHVSRSVKDGCIYMFDSKWKWKGYKFQ